MKATLLLLLLVSAAREQGSGDGASAASALAGGATVPPPQAYPTQTTLRPPGLAARDAAGTVKIDTAGKRVLVNWSYDGAGTRAFAYSQLDASFWPTAATAVDDLLIVAGRDPDTGNAVIEKWAFQYRPLPAPPVGDSYSPVVNKTRIYDANKNFCRDVVGLQKVHGSSGPAKVLVYFTDSKRVYDVNLNTGHLALVMTPEQEPALQKEGFQYMWSGEHGTQGHVYVLSTGNRSGDPSVLVLLDTNQDGTIDSSHNLDSLAWDNLLGPTSDWEQVFN